MRKNRLKKQVILLLNISKGETERGVYEDLDGNILFFLSFSF